MKHRLLAATVAAFVIAMHSSAFCSDVLYCFYEAGKTYDIDPFFLMAIAKVESGFNPEAVNRNRDGSKDIGLMQVNTYWLKVLPITENELKDPCINVFVGAWILKLCVIKYGYTPKAVDCYHRGEGRAKAQSAYVRRVFKVYEMLSTSAFADTIKGAEEYRKGVRYAGGRYRYAENLPLH